VRSPRAKTCAAAAIERAVLIAHAKRTPPVSTLTLNPTTSRVASEILYSTACVGCLFLRCVLIVYF
jgi:hypothetical protein